MFGKQIVNRHTVAGMVGLHDLGHFGQGRIQFRLWIGQFSFFFRKWLFTVSNSFGSVRKTRAESRCCSQFRNNGRCR